MDKELFTNIIRKARDEHGVKFIVPYNWTEPFLHPELPEFIRIIRQEDLSSMISTNLNIRRNIEEVIEAGPDLFRISLSGFYQENYGKTHVRGDIEKVKENMQLLSEAIHKHGKNKTLVTVFYHKYLHNLDEMQHMKNYTESLGFEWMEDWAQHITLEKLFELMSDTLSEKELAFINDQYALPVVEAVNLAKHYDNKGECIYLKDQLILDYQGNVNLCCATYDYDNNRLGNFLEMSDEDIKQAKTNHPTCSKCMGYGIDRYLTVHDIPKLHDQFEELAQSHIARNQ